MLHLIAVLDLVDKDFGGFEAGYVMLIDDDGGIARNIPCNFLLSLFVDETSETPDINVMTVAHVTLNNRKEGFNGVRYICFVDACIDTDLVDDVCFGHRLKGFGVFGFRAANLTADFSLPNG